MNAPDGVTARFVEKAEHAQVVHDVIGEHIGREQMVTRDAAHEALHERVVVDGPAERVLLPAVHDARHLVHVHEARVPGPAHPQVPVAGTAHGEMHVVAAMLDEHRAPVHQRVVGNVVAFHQLVVVELGAEAQRLAQVVPHRRAVHHTDVGIFVQRTGERREGVLGPDVVVELVGAVFAARNQQAFVHSQRRQA
jgi:hypothetical protein